MFIEGEKKFSNKLGELARPWASFEGGGWGFVWKKIKIIDKMEF